MFLSDDKFATLPAGEEQHGAGVHVRGVCHSTLGANTDLGVRGSCQSGSRSEKEREEDEKAKQN